MTERPLSFRVIGCIIEVYKNLGPGLLESIYENALMKEFELQGIKAQRQVPLAVNYKGTTIQNDLRMDIVVEDLIVLELKSVDELKPIYHKQLITYLKLSDKHLGFFVNFNVLDIMKGIKRTVYNLQTEL